MTELNFSEIIKLNNNFNVFEGDDVFEIGIISNISVQQCKPIIEYNLKLNNVNAKCELGEYDNILQDTIKFSKKDLLIYFWESCNFTNGFHYEVNLMSESQIQDFIKKKVNDINFLFEQTKNISTVIFNLFSSSIINYELLEENNFDKVCKSLNEYIINNKPENFVLINIDKIFIRKSISQCIDFRNFYSTKTLYTIIFLKDYINYINPIIKSLKGFSKKCLVLDCDNTLWNGIIGEDKIEGIQMSRDSVKGAIYYEIQNLIKSLHSKGILIALNSKNNLEDVEEVFENSKSIFLSKDDILLKKVNWINKSINLKEIANEINIGLDTLVFVDDSDFEINLIKKTLPEIVTLQVNKNIFLYPSEFRRISNLFFQISISKDDANRNKTYVDNIKRDSKKSSYSNFTDYLKSLNLEIKISKNDINNISRISQLTQKTNQFNLTTKRYSEKEITTFIKSSDYEVLSISAKDNYGDLGTIALLILQKLSDDEFYIDTFLMSCRAIGRNIELKILNEIISYLKSKNTRVLSSKYIMTKKNSQLNLFFEKNKFNLVNETKTEKKYILELKKYKYLNINYIKFSFNEK